jgi:Zn finger protein HypA/HybF involved in hydrogenase expression
MNDLISRSALKESLIHCKELGRKSFEAVLKVIDNQSTIEAVSVVHGRWIEDTHGNIICSKCKSKAKGDMSGIFRDRDFRQHKTPFCPKCGADMRKGGAE